MFLYMSEFSYDEDVLVLAEDATFESLPREWYVEQGSDVLTGLPSKNNPAPRSNTGRQPAPRIDEMPASTSRQESSPHQPRQLTYPVTINVRDLKDIERLRPTTNIS